MLPAGAGRAISIHPQVVGVDVDLLHIVGFRQNRDRAGRGMDSPLRLGGRYALHTVGAGFELQPGVDSAASDPADDLLVATVLAPRGR